MSIQIEAYKEAIRMANEHGLLEQEQSDVLTGFSGEKLVGAIQRLIEAQKNLKNTCYLEVGVFQGLTLLSAALANPDKACFGVDNFSFFNEENENHEIVKKRIEKLRLPNANIIDSGFEEAFSNLENHLGGRKIGVYFIDGPHDYRSQLTCLMFAKPYLADHAVILVDDSNYQHVRQANADFLRTFDEFALLFEAYTPAHPANLNDEKKSRALEGWWNGLNILVHDPDHILKRELPETGSRDLYYDSHEVFRHEFAGIAYPIMKGLSDVLDGKQEIGKVLDMAKLYRRENSQAIYKHRNTYSSHLPDYRFVESTDE